MIYHDLAEDPDSQKLGAQLGQLHERTSRSFREISEDLSALREQVLGPLTHIQSLDWLHDKKFLFVSAFGLVPLAAVNFLAVAGDLHSAYWALALYFSALWAFFFYHQFAPSGLRRELAITAFGVTAFLSVTVLLYAIDLPPLSWIRQGLTSPNDLTRLFAYFLGVGVPQELCKLAVIFWIANRHEGEKPEPGLLMFYGLMSGLGFGIYEGIQYQTGINATYDSSGTYLLNVLRLTSLPFLHAIWTAVAAYYVGLMAHFPQRKKGLIVLAIALPSFLHGLFEAVDSALFSFLLAFVSVYLMNFYRNTPAQRTPST